LSTLLLVLIFLLVVYMLAQHFLQRTVTGQTAAIDELTRQIAELSDMLSLEREANADLRLNIAQISAEMQNSIAERDALIASLALAEDERDTLRLRLDEITGEAEAALAEAAKSNQELLDALTRAEAGEEKVRVLLADIERLRRDIDSLRAVRADLESQVSQMAAALEEAESEVAGMREEFTALRDKSAELEARLGSEEERTALAQKELEEREIKLREVQALYLQSSGELDEERKLSQSQRDQIALLNQQILALRQQLARIEQALEVSEAKAEEQNVVIADLGRRLNVALAQKVEELARYRSEFFGRLREVLGERRDFTIVGDRFVFQSEVLFESGSAEIGASGKERLVTFADILNEVATNIPQELPWILQVDGHTDKKPIQTARFPSNWELSAARAISVVNFLIEQGLAPGRLSATGYGEFQPLDGRDDEIAYRRNRRIELRLTQR
jgi:chemotaxis protein MotB